MLILSACGDDADPTSAPAATATTAPAMMSPTEVPANEATEMPDHNMSTPGADMGTPGADMGMGNDVTSDTGAAALRTGLTNLLQEHVYLAGAATGAALGGREAEFEVAAATLDENSVDLSEAIGSVYGPEAGEAFLGLWRTHIGFFVDYTVGHATEDEAMRETALENLQQYGADFGAFLEGANPELSADAIAGELETHVATLTAAIDAQAAGDASAFDLLKDAADHMPMTAAVLANGIVVQNPDMFAGDSNSPASDLRAALNILLQEHAYLAGFATGAALDGRTADFEAAAATLDRNSVELSEAIGSVYGAEAEEAFLPGWRAHIVCFVDYTNGVATDDTAAQEQAVADLTQYAADFAAFLNAANGLPVDVVESLVMEHVVGLKTVVDAQAAGDAAVAYSELRSAAMHMSMLADPLAEATVQAFPETFAS